MITSLRDLGVLDFGLPLLDGASGSDIGRIEMAFKLDVVGILQVVDEDVRKVEREYYDPFLEDKDEIKKRLRKVEALSDDKQAELEHTIRKVEAIRTAEKTIEIELAKLREQTEKTRVAAADQTENRLYRKELERSNSVRELDIHIDLLMDTEQGLELLRQKFGSRGSPSHDLQQDHLREKHLQRADRTLLPDQRQTRVQEAYPHT